MNLIEIAKLILLSAIWGSSFIFMKILAPSIGPILTANLRLFMGGSVLIVFFLIKKRNLEFRKYWIQYTFIGVINSGLPFLLYSYAALVVPASYSVVLNATAPLFSLIFTSFWLEEKISPTSLLAIFLGISGVACLGLDGSSSADSGTLYGVFACLGAAACYGIGGVYIKKFLGGVKPYAMASCSQLLASLVFLPLWVKEPWTNLYQPLNLASLTALALICSSLAYLLYFSLIKNIGPTKALTVTFLMPLFGVFWAWLFLDETITPAMIYAGIFILAGTGLILRSKSYEAAPTVVIPPCEANKFSGSIIENENG